MRLIDFIVEDLKRFGKDPGSRKSRDRWNHLRRNMETYSVAKGFQPNVVDLMNPDFVYDFCSWLYDVHGQSCEGITVYNWVDVFGRMTRNAMRLGYIPKIDVAKPIAENLAKSHGMANKVDNAGRRVYDLSTPDFKKSLEKLLELLVKIGKETEGRLDSRTKHVLLYLFGVTLGGLEYEDIRAVHCRWETVSEGNLIPRLYLPRHDISVDFDGIPRLLWGWYNERTNRRPDEGEPLFPDLKADNETQFKADVMSFCSQNGIELYQSQSVLCDFMSIAFALGCSSLNVMRYAQWRKDPYHKDSFHRLFNKLISIDFDPNGLLSRKWRLLKVSSSAKLQLVSKAIDRIVKDGKARGLNCDIQHFTPSQEMLSKGDKAELKKKVPMYGSYIFVRSTWIEAERIERSIPDTTFVRNGRRMVKLSDSAVERLRLFYRTYHAKDSNLDFVDFDKWHKDQGITPSDGKLGRILQGPFQGYEGWLHQDSLIFRIAPLSDLAIAASVVDCSFFALNLTQ